MDIKLPKPKIGEPCNGCGICCMIQICNTGAFLLKKTTYLGEKTISGLCPALIERDGKYVCGFIVAPQRFIRSKYRPEVISRTVALCIGAGSGCDELGYDDNPAEEEALERMIDEKRNDSVWRESIKKAVDLLEKF